MRILFLILCAVLPLEAGQIKIFLKPSTVVTSNAPRLDDIARISGHGENLGDIAQITIDGTLCRDGFIDRKEIQSLLVPFSDEYIIYGSGVMLLPQDKDNTVQPYVIEKGDMVTVRVVNRGIVIETIGRALASVRKNEEVTVTIANSTRLTGTVREDKTVEVMP
ncbi:MAG: flagella basal body P-ring formation protein FlgA [Spirochaetota bacterium]